MKYSEIADKVENVNTWEDAREKLTDEELVCYLIHDCPKAFPIMEGDARIVAGILKAVGSANRSIRHSRHLLDVAKHLIGTIGRFNF